VRGANKGGMPDAPNRRFARIVPGRRHRTSQITDMRGRAALVTGASGGLGRVIARRLHQEGAELVVSGRRGTELQTIAAELGASTKVLPADLACVEAVVRLAEKARGVDIFVANAGLPANGELADLAAEDIARAVDINVRATLVLTRCLVEPMLERHSGHVVIVGSLAGLASSPRSSVYNASKFALRGFGHALHEELRGTGVGVSLVSPTFVSDTGMWADTGLRAKHPEVSAERVAAACVEAIRTNKAELLVAPVTQRVVVRMAVLFPQLLQPVLRSSAVPPEAVAAQKYKR
jgi:short-subunit dehydrogenase